MKYKTNPSLKKIQIIISLSFFAFCLMPIKSYAITIEDVIKSEKLDLEKDEHRCDLTFLIENNYADIFNTNQIEYYNVIIGDYSKYNDSGITFRVILDKNKTTKVAKFFDSDRFFIIKLKNGEMIGNKDGYFVPFDKIEILNNSYKMRDNFVVQQNSPPQDKIKYFYVKKCKLEIINNNQ